MNIIFESTWKLETLTAKLEICVSRGVLELSQISKMELLVKNSKRLKIVNCIFQKLHLRCFTGIWILEHVSWLKTWSR